MLTCQTPDPPPPPPPPRPLIWRSGSGTVVNERITILCLEAINTASVAASRCRVARDLNTPTTKAKNIVLFLNIRRLQWTESLNEFSQLEPKGNFPDFVWVHARVLCMPSRHAATPADWVELNFVEVCTLIRRIYMMYTPRRGFKATLITCIFYLLSVFIITGRWFFLKIQFIRSVFDKLAWKIWLRFSTLTWGLS